MAKKAETKVPETINSVEALQAKISSMREAQKKFATFTQEQVDKIFFEAAMAANKCVFLLQDWLVKRQVWVCWKIRLSKTTMRQNIHTTLIKE